MSRHKIVILEDDPGWLRVFVEWATMAGKKLSNSLSETSKRQPEVVGCSTVEEASAEMADTDLLIVDRGINEEGLPAEAQHNRGLNMLEVYVQTPAIVVSSLFGAQEAFHLRDQYENVFNFFEKATIDQHKFIAAIHDFLEENPPRSHDAKTSPSIFVSYSSIDAEKAKNIIEQLKAAGVPGIWIDTQKIEPGDNIVDRLGGGLDSCATLLVLCSKSSLESIWVKMEWQTAWIQGKKIIPIKLDDCEIPAVLQSLHHVELSAGDEEAELKALAEKLRTDLAD